MRVVPYGCCQCGCGKKTDIAAKTRSALGWIKGEPKPYLSRHRLRKGPHPYIEEDRGYKTPCWVWQWSVTADGYGVKWEGTSKRNVRAHRWYYERYVGPIPEGLQIDHLCRTRACCNPDHLEPVTNLVNSHRGRNRKLDPADVAHIRSTSGSASALGRHYGVTHTTIRQIREGTRWPINTPDADDDAAPSALDLVD